MVSIYLFSTLRFCLSSGRKNIDKNSVNKDIMYTYNNIFKAEDLLSALNSVSTGQNNSGYHGGQKCFGGESNSQYNHMNSFKKEDHEVKVRENAEAAVKAAMDYKREHDKNQLFQKKLEVKQYISNCESHLSMLMSEKAKLSKK